jgi:hypothetical protein
MKGLRNLCLFISILAFMSLFVGAKASHAATLYVATTGSDGNPGTAAAPFRTLRHGISRMRSGDTLVVKAGTYPEGNLTPPSGSAGAPTIIQAAAGETVKIQPNNRGTDCILNFTGGQHDITWDGVVLDGGNPAGSTRLSAFLVCAADGISYARLTIKNSELTHSRHSGMLIVGNAWELRNNNIHDNGTDSNFDHGVYFSADHSLVIGNRFANNSCYNIQNYYSGATPYDPTTNTYENNTFTGSRCGVTLSMGSNHIFKNNVSYNDNTSSTANALAGIGPNAKIFNNTFYRNGLSGGTGICATCTGNSSSGGQIRNNIVCGFATPITTGSAASSNNITTTSPTSGCPAFVNPGSGDLHLASGSSAINAGTTLSEVTTDHDGVSRPQGTAYDIGAYEFRSIR